MLLSYRSRLLRTLGAIAVTAAVLAPLAIPSPAQAWWRGGWHGGWGGGVFIGVAPPVYVAPPVVYAPPPIAYGYGPVWVPAHVNPYGYWVPGHWR